MTRERDHEWLHDGTDTGFPNSSATNWNTSTNSYRIQLHCTNDTDYAFFLGYV